MKTDDWRKLLEVGSVAYINWIIPCISVTFVRVSWLLILDVCHNFPSCQNPHENCSDCISMVLEVEEMLGFKCQFPILISFGGWYCSQNTWHMKVGIISVFVTWAKHVLVTILSWQNLPDILNGIPHSGAQFLCSWKKTMDLHLCAKGQGGLQLFVDLSKWFQMHNISEILAS